MTPLVAHVAQPVEAGVARVVLDLLLDQQTAGWRVHLVSPVGWLAEHAVDAGIPTSRWDATRDPGPNVAWEVLALHRLLDELDPSLVHLHSSKAGLAGRLALRERRPTVFSPHAWSFAAATGPHARAALAWERTAARWTTLQVACSREEAEQGRQAGIGGRVEVVANAVDLSRFTVSAPAARLAARAALGLDAEAPVALCVGRLSRQKGQDVLLAAWPEVRHRVPGALLLLAGDGPERQSIAAAAPEGVCVLGARDDVGALLAAADVAVLPSRWEGLALALLEAMASGRCVVATEVAGSRSVLLDGDLAPGGAVVPVADPRALADAVVRRLQDRSLAEAEGLAGRLRAEAGHDLARATARVRALYESLVPP